MALIKCSECESEISDKAEACPKCGNPMRPSPHAQTKRDSVNREKKRQLTGMVVVLAAVIGIIVWATSNSGNQTTSAPTSSTRSSDTSGAAPTPQAEADQQAPAEPNIKISALDLYKAYHANEVAADGQYKGRMLVVSGTVTTIGKDIMDDPYVSLQADNEFETVNAYFGKDKVDELSRLKKGDSISVTCRGNGMTIGSPVLDCKN